MASERPSPRVETRIPIEEVEVPFEKYSVLASLYDTRPVGRPLGPHLVQKSLEGKRIGAFGPSGVGKTTLMLQLRACAEENARRLNIPYDGSFAQYDDVLTASKDKAEGNVLNQELEETFAKVKLFETVGMGRTNFKNRGKKNLHETLAKMASGEDPDTILIGLPQILTNTIHSSYLRTDIANLHSDQLFDYLEKHNISVQGVPKTRQFATGIIEKYKAMGQREHIDAISNEENELISDWALNMQITEMKFEGDTPPSILDVRAIGIVVPSTLNSEVIRQIYSDFGMPEDFSDIAARKGVESFTSQAIRMEYMFRDEYGLGPDRAIVAASPWQSGPVVLDLSPYFSQAA